MSKKKKGYNPLGEDSLQAFIDFVGNYENLPEAKNTVVETLFDLSFRQAEIAGNQIFENQLMNLRIQFDMLSFMDKERLKKLRKKLKKMGDVKEIESLIE